MLSRILLCVAVATVVACVSSVPGEARRSQHHCFLGLDELCSPSSRHGRHVSQRFNHEPLPGRFVKLHYEAELVDGIIELDDLILDDDDDDDDGSNSDKTVTELLTKSCDDNKLILDAGTNEYAALLSREWHQKPWIVGGRHWNCTDSSLGPAVLVRSVSSVAVSGRELIVRTVPAGYPDVFRHAKVHFATNLLGGRPTAAAQPHPVDPMHATSTRRGRSLVGGFFSNFFTDIWDSVSEVADFVEDVVVTVVRVADFVATGSYEFSSYWDDQVLNLNYDADTNSSLASFPLSSNVTCQNCFLTSDVGAEFVFDLEDYTLNQVLATLSGSLQAVVNGTLDASDQWSDQARILLVNGSLPSISFWIGPVPVVMDFSVPLYAGFNATVQEEGTLVAHASVSGSFSFGVNYTDAAGMQTISKHTFGHDGELGGLSWGVAGDLQLYVLPVFVVSVDKVFQINLGVQSYIELSLDVSDVACKPYGAYRLASTWGVVVTLGGGIHVHVLNAEPIDENIPAITIFSTKRPLANATGCLFNDVDNSRGDLIGADSISLITDILVPGMTWAGMQSVVDSPRCSRWKREYEVWLSFQVVELGQNLYLFGSVGGLYSDLQGVLYSCTSQALYSASLRANGDLYMSPVDANSGYYDFFSHCTNPQGYLYPVQQSGTLSPDLSTLKIASSDGCAVVVLSNVATATWSPPTNILQFN